MKSSSWPPKISLWYVPMWVSGHPSFGAIGHDTTAADQSLAIVQTRTRTL